MLMLNILLLDVLGESILGIVQAFQQLISTNACLQGYILGAEAIIAHVRSDFSVQLPKMW